MLKKILISCAGLLPAMAFAFPHHHHHHFLHHAAPEIDGAVAILGLAILGGALSFMKRKAK